MNGPESFRRYQALRNKLVDIAESGEGQDLVDELDRLWSEVNAVVTNLEERINRAEEWIEKRKDLEAKLGALEAEVAKMREEQEAQEKKVKEAIAAAAQTRALADSFNRAAQGAVQGN